MNAESVWELCRGENLDAPVLIHVGSSRVFRCGDVAVRVTDETRNPSTLADAEIVVAGAEMHRAGVRVVEPLDTHVRELSDRSFATLWRWIDSDPTAMRLDTHWTTLGGELRLFHRTGLSTALRPLGELLPARIATRLEFLTNERPEWLDPAVIAHLQSVSEELLPTIAEAAAGNDAVHGDFHHGNVLWSVSGPVIADLEGLSRGNGAYDLAVLTERVRCYGLDPSHLGQLVAGYGTALRDGDRFETLVRTKQMISTLWCAVQAVRWESMVGEAVKRLAWWENESGPAWHTNPGAQPR
jgi:Ser/Thr protein kinase RdoA (MazF antagonist)